MSPSSPRTLSTGRTSGRPVTGRIPRKHLLRKARGNVKASRDETVIRGRGSVNPDEIDRGYYLKIATESNGSIEQCERIEILLRPKAAENETNGTGRRCFLSQWNDRR